MTEEEAAKIIYSEIIKAIRECQTSFCEYHITFPDRVEINGTTYKFSKIIPEYNQQLKPGRVIETI